ncbi:hypothetical protein NLM27_26680 [Bradyrhizobium sp. CCGB12]|uniref:hypothetical protein n=1 Tax=Bradyrhizobium sp. CCGB12 TaxID=2949632 RepID=UPI0020B27187|nr:hypothetical protein [Bradyrhizobium sp. CCGB12]MCP3392339.1 hypothetical protein [Bradyrhizobium sp. CCGB12]
MQLNIGLIPQILIAGAILWLGLFLFIVLKREYFRGGRSIEQTALELTNIHKEFLDHLRATRGPEFFRTLVDAGQLKEIYRDFLWHLQIRHPLQSFQRSRELSGFAIAYREFIDHLDDSGFFVSEVHDAEVLQEEFRRFLERQPRSLWLAFGVVGTLVLSAQLAVAASPAALVIGGLLAASSLYRGDEIPNRAYWNTWFEYDDGSPQDSLTVGNRYTFFLDLSPFEYAKLRASPVATSGTSPKIQTLLDEKERKQLTLMIKPLLAGGSGLHFSPEVGITALEADLERIRSPNDEEAKRYARDGGSLAKFSKKVAADTLRFKIFADVAGCSVVVFSILDVTGLIPLDHLVRWVAIANPGQKPPPCGDRQIHAGLETLLEVSLDVEAAGTGNLAAAAFHIFDINQDHSFVVFADGRPDRKRAYAWETEESVVKHVNDASRLPLLIKEARDMAVKGTPGSYAKVANELANVLFTGRGSTEDEATKAKQAFKELVEHSATRPVIVTRAVSDSLVGGRNQSFYVPLGILGAKAATPDGAEAVLKQPITVVQPLPRERYATKNTCIDKWTFGVPNKLQDVNENVADLMPRDPPGAWFHDFAKLQTYLLGDPQSDGPSEKSQLGQGFLLLAHHGRGHIWFEREQDRVIVSNVKRRYPEGSVGVFAACAVTAAYDAGFLQQFNARGIDALIASPFSIPATYGTRLAAEFPGALQDLMESKGVPTITDLFNLALERTASRLERDFGKGRYEEIGLEYLLLGNPGLVLCDKTGARKQ